jgi:hypothetical protein
MISPTVLLHFRIGKREFQQPCKNITLKFSNNHSIKIARVTGLMQDDHNDLDTTILNDRHIYDVVV